MHGSILLMKVKHLKLENVRGFNFANFDFQPDFNLVIGENGVGKSSALDALRLCLSSIVSRVGKVRSPATIDFSNESATEATPQEIECQVQHGTVDYLFSYIKCPERKAVRKFEPLTGVSQIIDQQLKPPYADNVHKREIPGHTDFSPLAIHFSTQVPSLHRNGTARKVSNGGTGLAFSGALSDRGVNLGELGQWLQAKAESDSMSIQSKATPEMVENSLTRFLPNYKNLVVGGKNQRELFIQNGRGTIPVRNLSEGERRLFSIVFDIIRRLSLANPGLANPVADAGAIVLIDEIELHLHPKYQRKIVHDLMEVFPKCQFIATTNSPQVIGEVKSENIHSIEENEVYSLPYSYGVDSSRILEEIMDVSPRTKEVHQLLGRINEEINDSGFDRSNKSLQLLIEILGENDPEVVEILTFLSFMERE